MKKAVYKDLRGNFIGEVEEPLHVPCKGDAVDIKRKGRQSPETLYVEHVKYHIDFAEGFEIIFVTVRPEEME